jgi:hypothetical protein
MRRTRHPRGSVILFSVFLILVLLAFGGLAVDVGALVTARSELALATDAAALAGAGNLGFDETAFPDARNAAVLFASRNPTRFGPVSLNTNDPNNDNGDVVLGVWSGTSFTRSLDGIQVNAIRVRTTQQVPMSFLRIVGITSVPVSASSIAISNPPSAAPACLFPVGLTTCTFMNDGAFTSDGCGTPVSFKFFPSSSSHFESSGMDQQSFENGGVVDFCHSGNQGGGTTDTGGWTNLTGSGQPTPTYLNQTIQNVVNGTCPSEPAVGDTIYISASNFTGASNAVGTSFRDQFNRSGSVTIKDSDGNVTYRGKAWEVYVPLIQTGCPATTISGNYTIQGFAKFAITQVIDDGGSCQVNNPADPNSYPLCARHDATLSGMYGFFHCEKMTAPPARNPTPRSALTAKPQLVQ